MAPFDANHRDWHGRMARCLKLANLARAETSGARLAALAVEIEKQLNKLSELSDVVEETRRHCVAMMAAIDDVLARARSDLFFGRLALRDQTYRADKLREEAQLCRDEALACHDGETKLDFASRAVELAMLGEAVSRIPE